MPAITVIGAGPLGAAVTRHLIGAGHDVTVATRSATPLDGARSARVDVTRRDGADTLPAAHAIVACCNFTYTAAAWEASWPAAIDVLVRAAEARAATLVIAGNLYAAGPTTAPMREVDPPAPSTRLGRVRAEVWATALAAHRAGRIRAVEVRASDYVGAGAATTSAHSWRAIGPAAAGRGAWVVGDPDAPHAWTSTDDIARLLARAALDPAMGGRAWHVPSAPAVSSRELARVAARLAGRDGEPRVRAMPAWALRASGAVSPMLRAVDAMSYQFASPLLLDDTDARTRLGETHTPLYDSIAAQLETELARAKSR